MKIKRITPEKLPTSAIFSLKHLYKIEIGEFLDYVYEQYGFSTYRILLDAHSWNMKRQEIARAKESAKVIIPMIEKLVNSEDPASQYNEFLAFEIWKHGNSLKRKTANNMTSYGSVYEFYFGYLLGAGMLEGIAM